MHVFRELFIRGEPDRLLGVGTTIRDSLGDGWAPDTGAEDHMRKTAVGARAVFCFASPKRDRRPAATVFLVQKADDTLYVANVVPHHQHELSHDEYNAILEEFFHRFAYPAAETCGARAELTEPEADLETWLSPGTATKLRTFSALANKRTGSSHPLDRERWYEFIRSAHEEQADFSSSALARWLHEEGGWDAELSNHLAIEYEFARGLLASAHGQAVGA